MSNNKSTLAPAIRVSQQPWQTGLLLSLLAFSLHLVTVESHWPKRGRDNFHSSIGVAVGPLNVSSLRSSFTLPLTSVSYNNIICASDNIMYVSGGNMLYGYNITTNTAVQVMSFAAGSTTSGSTMNVALMTDGVLVMNAHDGFLYAAFRNGTQKWRSAQSIGTVSYTPLTVSADNTIFFGTSGGTLYGIWGSNGLTRYTITGVGVVNSGGVVSADGSTFYIVTNNALRAYNLSTLSERWNQPLGGPSYIHALLNPIDGTVYAGTDTGYKFIAANPNGTLRWSYSSGTSYLYGDPAFSVDYSTIFLNLCSNGQTVGLWASSGTVRWTAPVNTGCSFMTGMIVGGDNTLYLTSGSGIFAINGHNGNLVWSSSIGNSVTSPAMAPDGSVITLISTTVRVYGGTASSNSTACNVPNSPYLDMTRSQVSGNNVSIAVTFPRIFNSVVVNFVGGLSNCSSDNPQAANDWWRVVNTTCTQSIIISNTLQNVVGTCNFGRDESQVDTTVFQAIMLVTTVNTSASIRGVVFNATSVTAISVTLSFGTAVNVSSNTLPIFGPAILAAQIQSQTFNSTASPPILTLTLVTSSQYPYQMALPLVPQVSGFTAVITPRTADGVLPSASICNATNVDTYGASGTCTQVWIITVTPSAACPTQNNFTADWSVMFQIRCHSSFTGICTSPTPTNSSIQFSTASDNYCPRLVANNAGVLSASLNTFQDAAFTTSQTSFVFGSTSFFRLTVNSTITMSHLNIERITITSGGAVGVSDMYAKPFTNAGTYFGTTGSFFNGADQAPSSMTVQDANGISATQATASFRWTWSPNISTATGDSLVPTTVLVAARVRFANVSLVGKHQTQSATNDDQLVYFKFSNNILSESSLSSTTANVRVQVSAGNIQEVATPVQQSSRGALFVEVAVGVCVFAGLVAVVAVALLIRKRRAAAASASECDLTNTAGEEVQMEDMTMDNEMPVEEECVPQEQDV